MSFVELYNEISPKVVAVITETSTGTGFFIDKRGYIATAEHIISGKSDIKIITVKSSPNTIQAKVVKRNQQLDIAILKIEISEDSPSAELGDSSSVNIGDEIIVLGFPFGNTIWGVFLPAIHRGIISTIIKILNQTDGKVTKRFQLDAMINKGNSGGPLALKNGKVIGVVTQVVLEKPIGESILFEGKALTTPTGIGIATPIDYVKEILEEELLKNDRGKVN